MEPAGLVKRDGQEVIVDKLKPRRAGTLNTTPARFRRQLHDRANGRNQAGISQKGGNQNSGQYIGPSRNQAIS